MYLKIQHYKIKAIMALASLVIVSCDNDTFHEKLENYELRLTIDRFISVFEESARIKDNPVPVYITLVGNGNPYDNQYIVNTDSELTIDGLVDKDYTIFANALYEGKLYYKEIKFNPAATPKLNIILEGIVTKFRVVPTSWPEGCGKVEVHFKYTWVTMIDETGYYLNKIFTGVSEHEITLTEGVLEPEYKYTTPFFNRTLEISIFDNDEQLLFSTEKQFEKLFERLKSYTIKLDLTSIMQNKSSSLSFSMEDLVFEELELSF